ncbi:MAG TPA: ankyrin repeat domain-containing protein [Pirellulales bacterium]|nr:ankyrin repeat domain-containing protein [Pirellulales bacterium]
MSAVLLGLVTPHIRRTLRGWEFQEDFDRRVAIAEELNEAVRANDVALARRAIGAGANPNLDPRENLLNLCIVHGRVEMMELLLASGMAAEAGSLSYGNSPLYIAARSSPPDVRCQTIRILVAAGADPRRQDGHPPFTYMDIAFASSDAQTADLLREYGLPYGPREMAGLNRLNDLKRAVEQSPEIVKERFRTRWAPAGQDPTLLAIAIERGHREMSRFLIESGAPLDTVAYHGSTLLHLAAHGGDPELIRLLVAHGLDVNAVDGNSNTPLAAIAWSDKTQAVAALLEAGSSANHRGWLGGTPLHSAGSGGQIKIVRMLLAARADPALVDEQGKTPLDLARTRKRTKGNLH